MNTSIKISIAITYILAVIASSCVGINGKDQIKPSGVTKIVTKEVPAFDNIEADGAIDVVVNIGNKNEVIIQADSAIMPYIVTGVKDGELKIYNKDMILYNNTNNNKILVTITTPSLLKLESSGACDVKINDLKTDKFKVSLSGACDLTGNFECNVLDFESSGASDAKLKGKVKNCNIELSGASEIKAFELVANKIKIEASGSSNIDITVEDSLDVDLSGSSELRYKGEPKSIKQSISGASEIKKINQ